MPGLDGWGGDGFRVGLWEDGFRVFLGVVIPKQHGSEKRGDGLNVSMVSNKNMTAPMVSLRCHRKKAKSSWEKATWFDGI